jgi:hypothetical protein
MLGVSTIGNAILIAYDDKPIFATDPWFGDEHRAFFGSWGLSHCIPPDCKADIREHGIIFAISRHSLMTAIEFEVFCDFFIGNFMQTTLHKIRSFYDDDFNLAVTKFSDNGGVSSYHELDNYLKEYRRRAGAADWYCQRASQMVTAYLPRESPVYRIAQRLYWTARL